MSQPPIRFGIVGCGAVAERYHLPALQADDLATLTSVVDPSRERARSLAARSGAAAFTRHEDLVGAVDAAIVAVPNHLHAPIATDLLHAGIHVLVEKPLAPDVAGCDAICAAADSSGATLAVGLDFRFAPAIRFVKALLDANALGSPRSFDLRHGTESRWPLATPYLFDRERAGGGVLMDHGAHLLDHILWWLGPSSVESYLDDARGGVEADAVATFVSASGARGTVELSRTRTLRNTCLIECALGEVEVSLFEPYARVAVRLADGTPQLAAHVGDDEFAAQPYLALFRSQLTDFIEALTLGRPAYVPGSEGRRAIALISACYERRQPLEQPWDYARVYEVTR